MTVTQATRIQELQDRLAAAEAARLRAETAQRSATEEAEFRSSHLTARHEAQLQVPSGCAKQWPSLE